MIPAFVGSNPTCPVRGLLGSPTLDLVVPFTLIVEAVKSRHKAREGLIVYNPTIHERENQPVVKTSVIGRVDIYTPFNC